ncbi:ABC transporter ATP-binding protein [Fontibacillus sp. BL9]|uniref:ABC transporter ATP-binding protein n=1 Tax=Fontibacillus sp. BL9 TaxID=3389971 RepID=UPI00397A662A
MDKIIEVSNLHKSYGNVHAVKGISFYVEKGKLFAFLGPNGAGKSTTIDIICTFLKQDSGEVSLNGHELGREDDQIRSVIGVVFQDGLLDPLLTIEENLRIRGGFYGLKGAALDNAVHNAATATGVSDLLKRHYGKLSGGQRRRCDIARALVNTPTILFLDEPTTGLDPQTRKSVWETIKHLQKKTGMTVFLTTHYMEEAAEADYILVIDDGQIAAKGTPAELKENYSHDKLSLNCTNIDQVCRLLDERDTSYTCIADRIVIPLPSTMEALPIIEACKDHIRGFEVTSGTMDDAFIGITGKEVRA